MPHDGATGAIVPRRRDRVTAVRFVRDAARHLTGPTIVLVHGAGHTSRVWEAVRSNLDHPSLALDLPGRADRVADIAAVTIADAVASLAADVDGSVDGPLVLVGHSAGGIVLPGLAARLDGRVERLVFVAGLCARHGDRVIDTVRPDAAAELAARLASLRDELAGCMLDPQPTVTAKRAIDAKTAAPVDSLNYMHQAVSWDGVPADLPRVFVRCTRDRIQPRALQDALIENCAASTVVDIASGHTPSVAAPAALAEILDRIAGPSPDRPARAIIDG